MQTLMEACNAIAAKMSAFASEMSAEMVTLQEHGMRRPNLDDLAECVLAWREDVLDAGEAAERERKAPDPDYQRKTERA